MNRDSGLFTAPVQRGHLTSIEGGREKHYDSCLMMARRVDRDMEELVSNYTPGSVLEILDYVLDAVAQAEFAHDALYALRMAYAMIDKTQGTPEQRRRTFRVVTEQDASATPATH